MKLIALRGFANNADNLIVLDEGQTTTHPKGIDKGTLFSIGGDLPFENLPAAAKRLVKELEMAKCIGDANDKNVVAKIGKELEVEKRQREEQAKLVAGGSAAHIAQVVVQTLVTLGLVKPGGKLAKAGETAGETA